MYKKIKPTKTTIARNMAFEGETIEKKVNRIVNNKEKIQDGAPLVYTDRKDGVRSEFDPRTDRWELALDAMDKVNADKLAKRQDRQNKRLGEQAKEGMKKEGETPAGETINN